MTEALPAGAPLLCRGYNFSMLRRLLLTACIASILVACAPAAASPVTPLPSIPPAVESTPAIPSPTDIKTTPTDALPASETETPGPTDALTAEISPVETEQILPTPIPKNTVASTPIPQPSANSAAIQLYGPGPLSKIVSPLEIYGYAIPGYNHKGRVDLYGEDGRLLASELLQLNTVYKWAYFYWPLPFSISSAGELGRLTLSTQDQYGRLTAVNSVHLLLLPEGASILNPPGDLDLMERCIIEEPAAGMKVSGGVLSLSGKMLPFNDLPLTISLIGRDGSVLNSQLLPITPDGANLVPFDIDIPYSLSGGAWELLTVSQFDDRIGGLMYLYSQEIYFNP